MKDREIRVDDRTLTLLAAVVDAEDDPLLIAAAAQVDPNDFRQFISECGEAQDEDATKLLKAAEALQLANAKGRKARHKRSSKGYSFLPGPTDSGLLARRASPFRLVLMLNLGLAVSLAYGLLASALVFYFDGKSEAQLFFAAYTGSFKTVISLGLMLGTSLIIFLTQDVVPQTIEKAFTESQLSETDYSYYKRRFASLRLSIQFSAEFIVIGFVIFSYCQFPLSRPGEVFMVIAACAEYALAVYVGRKLMYTGMMLHSLLPITVNRNLFRKRELDEINAYVQVASTLMIIFLYVHMIGYYGGPFVYGSILGQSVKTFLLLPVLIATPVLLIFNYYPRAVLRRLYSQSIDIDRQRLVEALQDEESTTFEKWFYLIEFDKMSRNQLRSNLTFTLSDLVVAITILIMLLELLRR